MTYSEEDSGSEIILVGIVGCRWLCVREKRREGLGGMEEYMCELVGREGGGELGGRCCWEDGQELYCVELRRHL